MAGSPPHGGCQPDRAPRHPRGALGRRAASTPEAGDPALGTRLDRQVGAPRSRWFGTASSDVRHRPRGARGRTLAVRMEVRLLAGEAGRALAAVQGEALAALLASMAEAEVGQGEEVSL